MTPDPILYESPETAETVESVDTIGYSPLWWLVVLVLSAAFWAALITLGIVIARML